MNYFFFFFPFVQRIGYFIIRLNNKFYFIIAGYIKVLLDWMNSLNSLKFHKNIKFWKIN